jgi:hypothetical protein
MAFLLEEIDNCCTHTWVAMLECYRLSKNFESGASIIIFVLKANTSRFMNMLRFREFRFERDPIATFSDLLTVLSLKC